MKIKSIKITNLFGIFDYNIAYPTNSNILIITGPNGYGKTQILNIIYNVFNKKFGYFKKLTFSEIEIGTNYGVLILSKDRDEIKLTMVFPYHEPIVFEPKDLENLGVIACNKKKWRKAARVKVFFSKLRVYLIKEQRLFRHEGKIQIEEEYYEDSFSLEDLVGYEEDQILISTEEEKEQIIINTVELYADELKDEVIQNIEYSFELTQKLDSSFAKRLITEKKILNKEEYEKRFEVVIQKQESLRNIGLYENKQEQLEYNEDDAKALTVYLTDLEKKLGVFDQLVEKIDLFTDIINERGFAFKTVRISKKEGLTFKNHKGEPIQIDQLSSGEKNKVALYYELIFNAKPNSLVLIDEPEISLHVTWQKEFLSDLEKIIALHQGMQTIVATHSPTIISDRWDWVHNLELKKGAVNG